MEKQDLIIAFIKEELNGEKQDLVVDIEEDLLGSGLVESMGMMRLVQFVEDAFEIKVEPQDMTIDNFITVQAIVDFVSNSQ
jgi:acyl carrier protein